MKRLRAFGAWLVEALPDFALGWLIGDSLWGD